MNCPKCNSRFVVKAGFVAKKQRFKCNECQTHFIDPQNREQRTPQELKSKAVNIVKNGASLRKAARMVGMSHVSILKWVKQAEEAM